jgi:ElaB/YqjD/DUF883 family membrane-anchored ribosome-binding protein
MSRRPYRFLFLALGVHVLVFTGFAAADDPVLDPSEPPVRLKKKNRPPRKVEPPKDDVKKGGEAKREVPDPEKPQQPKIGDDVKKPVEKKGPTAEDERKKIVERILKNLEKAEQKLAKHDPGTTTREIQRDILKDLDKLIEQTRNQPPPQGGTSSRSQSRKNRQKSNSSKGSGTPDKTNSGAGRNNPKEGKGGSSKPRSGKDKKSGTQNSSGSAGKSKPKDKNRLNDLFKDVWGHLPETLRQEMDAYSRARFLPEYDIALKQYYRTLSEQGRKK